MKPLGVEMRDPEYLSFGFHLVACYMRPIHSALQRSHYDLADVSRLFTRNDIECMLRLALTGDRPWG